MRDGQANVSFHNLGSYNLVIKMVTSSILSPLEIQATSCSGIFAFREFADTQYPMREESRIIPIFPCVLLSFSTPNAMEGKTQAK